MGLTKPRAAQIYNLDYKQSTRVVTVANVALSGGAPATVDGVTLSLNDRILVTAQSTASQNGLYYVTTVGSGSNGTWARTSDGNETGEIEAGMIVMVTAGTIYADTQWKLTTDDPITVGSTALTFVQNYSANSISSGTSNVVVTSNANVTISSAGTANVVNIGNTAVTFTGNIFPSANVTYSLGNTALRWKDLWLANSTLYIGNVSVATSGSTLTINGANVLVGNAGSAFSTSGNVTGGNVLTSGLVSATGNVTGGNIVTAGAISTTGNAYVGNILTNGYYYANGVVFGGGGGGTPGGANTQIQFNDNGAFNGTAGLTFNKTTNAVATTGAFSATGNITGGNLSGTNIVGTLTTAAQTNITSVGTLGSLTVTANIQGGNLRTAGSISATGAITGAAITGSSLTVTTGNITAGNLLISGAIIDSAQLDIQTSAANANIVLTPNGTGNVNTGANLSVTGNIQGGNLRTTGLISATGNINAGNVIATGLTGTLATAAQTNITSVGTLSSLTVTANVQGGNLRTAGLISATGTVTGSSFTGAGTGLTGNAASLIAGSATAPTFTGDSATAGNIVSRVTTGFYENSLANTATGWPLNSGTWQHLIASTHSNDANYYSLQLAASFFEQGLYYRSTNGSGATTWSTVALYGTTPSFAGITNSGANGVGNIGSSTTYFNTVFAKATSAQYADLAEMYSADSDYAPGTVVAFGGPEEITISNHSHSTQVAGIISTNPSYLMNSAHAGEHVLPVALTGRVPCQVVGTIRKGDRLVTSTRSGVATVMDKDLYEPGCIVGKSLEDYDSTDVGIIEVAVGRF